MFGKIPFPKLHPRTYHPYIAYVSVTSGANRNIFLNFLKVRRFLFQKCRSNICHLHSFIPIIGAGNQVLKISQKRLSKLGWSDFVQTIEARISHHSSVKTARIRIYIFIQWVNKPTVRRVRSSFSDRFDMEHIQLTHKLLYNYVLSIL